MPYIDRETRLALLSTTVTSNPITFYENSRHQESMFPLRDHNPSNRTPYVTYALLTLNICIFLLCLPLYADNDALHHLFVSWGVVPREIIAGSQWQTLISSMFLHGGFLHLLGNMLFLHIVGDNIEDQMGHWPFLGFYLATGIIASMTQVLWSPSSAIPMIGASGAVAGVMGSYLLLFPKARIDILFILVIFFRVFSIPAWICLGIWLTLQFVNGLAATSASGGVAYWAHAGGFIAGVVVSIPLWLRLGDTAFWYRNEGHPPHKEAEYQLFSSGVPKVRNKSQRAPYRR